MYYIAHRGWVRNHPENTLEAFAAAWAAGMDGFETDIRCDRDGVAILFHDRCAANGLPVNTLSRAQLSEIQGYHVPTLSEALATFPTAYWNLELKSADCLDATRSVLEAQAQPFKGLISSFHHQLILIIARDTTLPCALLMANSPARTINLYTMLASVPRPVGVGLVFDFEVASGEQIAELTRQQVPCWIYGLQHADEYATALTWPLAGLIADHPEQLPGLKPRVA
ncbi:glycerophosphodiester phosphodiesterase [Chitinibacter fontanus]|uniref:Glycerophosphodiester phosphodiesterase n=1 Tax=Chitinibacter fontanus TaxID=1737446 RepID=A0A7D5VBD3_9NEIS|nr:glycerophosphodiester phosphodiesterase [Chitinibacter fontanus]QLI82715.1 glycerophosphodiester phosphodiesterase [Chitinibacter fontanus]